MARVLADHPRQRFLMITSDADEVASPALLRYIRARASAVYYTEVRPVTDHSGHRGYSMLVMEVYRYGWQWKEPFWVRVGRPVQASIFWRVHKQDAP